MMGHTPETWVQYGLYICMYIYSICIYIYIVNIYIYMDYNMDINIPQE